MRRSLRSISIAGAFALVASTIGMGVVAPAAQAEERLPATDFRVCTIPGQFYCIESVTFEMDGLPAQTGVWVPTGQPIPVPDDTSIAPVVPGIQPTSPTTSYPGRWSFGGFPVDMVGYDGIYVQVGPASTASDFAWVRMQPASARADGTVGRVRQIRSYAMGTLADFRAFVDEKPWIADPAGGGFFFDQAVHNFDFMRHLTGSEARQVFAFVTTQSDAPWPGMSVMAQVGFADGTMAQLNLCFELPDCLVPEQTFRFEVVAEHGMLDFDMYTSVRLGQRGTWTTVWSQPSFDFVNDPNSPIRLEAHAAMLQEFIDSVRERRRPAITADDGIAAVALCEACLRSARTGAVVHLG